MENTAKNTKKTNPLHTAPSLDAAIDALYNAFRGRGGASGVEMGKHTKSLEEESVDYSSSDLELDVSVGKRTCDEGGSCAHSFFNFSR